MTDISDYIEEENYNNYLSSQIYINDLDEIKKNQDIYRASSIFDDYGYNKLFKNKSVSSAKNSVIKKPITAINPVRTKYKFIPYSYKTRPSLISPKQLNKNKIYNPLIGYKIDIYHEDEYAKLSKGSKNIPNFNNFPFGMNVLFNIGCPLVALDYFCFKVFLTGGMEFRPLVKTGQQPRDINDFAQSLNNIDSLLYYFCWGLIFNFDVYFGYFEQKLKNSFKTIKKRNILGLSLQFLQKQDMMQISLCGGSGFSERSENYCSDIRYMASYSIPTYTVRHKLAQVASLAEKLGNTISKANILESEINSSVDDFNSKIETANRNYTSCLLPEYISSPAVNNLKNLAKNIKTKFDPFYDAYIGINNLNKILEESQKLPDDKLTDSNLQRGVSPYRALISTLTNTHGFLKKEYIDYIKKRLNDSHVADDQLSDEQYCCEKLFSSWRYYTSLGDSITSGISSFLETYCKEYDDIVKKKSSYPQLIPSQLSLGDYATEISNDAIDDRYKHQRQQLLKMGMQDDTIEKAYQKAVQDFDNIEHGQSILNLSCKISQISLQIAEILKDSKTAGSNDLIVQLDNLRLSSSRIALINNCLKSYYFLNNKTKVQYIFPKWFKASYNSALEQAKKTYLDEDTIKDLISKYENYPSEEVIKIAKDAVGNKGVEMHAISILENEFDKLISGFNTMFNSFADDINAVDSVLNNIQRTSPIFDEINAFKKSINSISTVINLDYNLDELREILDSSAYKNISNYLSKNKNSYSLDNILQLEKGSAFFNNWKDIKSVLEQVNESIDNFYSNDKKIEDLQQVKVSLSKLDDNFLKNLDNVIKISNLLSATNLVRKALNSEYPLKSLQKYDDIAKLIRYLDDSKSNFTDSDQDVLNISIDSYDEYQIIVDNAFENVFFDRQSILIQYECCYL